MKTIEAVIFDLEGTLFNSPQLAKKHHEAIVNLIADRKRISSKAARTLFSSARTNLFTQLEYEPATVTTAISLGINRHEFFEATESIDPSQFVQPNHRLKRMLSDLRELSKVGLLTNVSRKTVAAILNALELDTSEFEAIVSGDEVPENKPSPYPFLKTVSNLHVRPSRTVMVGDRIAIDLMPAKKLNMTTILIGKLDNPSPHVDFAVNDVAEVYSTIAQIRRIPAQARFGGTSCETSQV